MKDARRRITEQEDVIVAGADVTLGQLLHSECIKREAEAATAGIRLDLERGIARESMPLKQILFQDIFCISRNTKEAPCLKDGGTACYAAAGENQMNSVMGNKKVRTPACSQACPVGVDVPAVLEHMRNNKKLEAQRTLMKYHPLTEMVCLMCRKCSAHCVQNQQNQGVGAEKILHWLGADIGRHPEIFFIPPSGDSGKWIAIEEVTVAGLTAAYYLRRMGNHVAIFKKKKAREVLACFSHSLAEAMEGSLAAYMACLSFMGVVFEDSAIGEKEPGRFFDHQLSWKTAEKTTQETTELQSVLEEICLGVKTASRINLDFGLKSYLEPMGPLGSFQFEGVEISPSQWAKPLEDTQQQTVLQEAARCVNCGCFGVCESRTETALFMLETEIHTSKRVIRAQDYFAEISPWKKWEPGEEAINLVIPKSGDFVSGCVCDKEITLAYAFLGKTGTIMDLRMAFGGIAPVPIRLSEAEKALKRSQAAGMSAKDEAAHIMDMAKPRIVLMKKNKGKLLRMEKLIAHALENYLNSLHSV